MAEYATLTIVAFISLLAGILIGRVLLKRFFQKHKKKAEQEADLILKEAKLSGENIKKDKILEAKEKFLKLRADFEEEATRKKNQIISNENRLKQREQKISQQAESVNRKESDIESLREKLTTQTELATKKREEMERIQSQQVAILEQVANLTADDAREQLIETLKDEAQTKASSLIKEIIEEAKLSATKAAKKWSLKLCSGPQPSMPLKIVFRYSISKVTT